MEKKEANKEQTSFSFHAVSAFECFAATLATAALIGASFVLLVTA